MFTLGGQVLLFMSFLVYRGASHTYIGMHLHIGSRRRLSFYLNNNPVLECPPARHCNSATSEEENSVVFSGDVVPSSGRSGGCF